MINQELSSNFNKHVEAMDILKNKILDENERIETEKTSLNFNFENLIFKNIKFNYKKKKLFFNLNFEIKKN